VRRRRGSTTLGRLSIGRIALLAVFWLSAATGYAASADDDTPLSPVEALTRAATEVEQVQREFWERKLARRDRLESLAAVLADLSRSPGLNEAGHLIARYYRAVALRLENDARREDGTVSDRDLAASALAEFDAVLAFTGPLPRSIRRDNVEYQAGVIALNYLKDAPRAYDYWRRCAETAHAGCVNVMADAKLSGAGGQSVDPDAAIALHLKVFRTGTQFTCAGAFSAQAIARVIHFTGHSPDGGGDAIEWMGKAYPLLDSLGDLDRGADRCQYSQFQIDEFLMRLAGGDRRDDLLRSARDRASDPIRRTLAAFLLGETDEAALDEATAATRDDYLRCGAHFGALWHFALQGDAARARRHAASMEALSAELCGSWLVFARKLLK
jgi:hypothetical protein